MFNVNKAYKQIKRMDIMNIKLIISCAFYSLSLVGVTAYADVCSDLKGAAWGMCKAAQAIDCEATPEKNACQKIAENYTAVTGDETPPWTDPPPPPVTCPCDYSQVPMTLDPVGPWNAPINYNCPEFPGEDAEIDQVIGTTLNDTFLEPPYDRTMLIATGFYHTDVPTSFKCEYRENGVITFQSGVITYEEVNACRDAIFAYAQAFFVANPDAVGVDNCTPTLP